MRPARIEGSLFPALPAATTSPAATSPAPAVSAIGDPAPGLRFDLGPVTDPAEVLAAVRWLRWGRCRGFSSEAVLFAALAGTAPADDEWHGRSLPSCRAEIYRCLRLTADLPWTRRGLKPLAAAYPAWAVLARAWDQLAATMAAEIGPSWPAVDLSSGRWPDTTKSDALLRKALAQGGVTF